MAMTGRADARRNRARIIAAAAELFAAYGHEVALDEIARRAEVGNATLYRNFGDREALLVEVVRSVMASTADAARRAAAEEDNPMAAVSGFMHAAAAAHIAALCPLLPTATQELSTEKQRLIDTGEALVVRAQDAGRMRADVTFADLLMALAQLTRPFPGVAADRFTARNLQVYLDGLAAPAPSTLTGPPPTVEDLRQTGNNLCQNRNED